MRYAHTCVLGTVLLFSMPSVSLAHGSVDGFGGLSIDKVSSVEGASVPFDVGGRVTFDLVPAVQAIGEAGRVGSVLPTGTDTLLLFTPFRARVSALYGEGGVRFLASPRSAVTPYIEATAGMARLDFSIRGLGSTADALTQAALNFVDRTEPIAGVGGGALIRGGPVFVDLGYRYKKIFANNFIGTVLGAGQGLNAHQVRIGIGVRF